MPLNHYITMSTSTTVHVHERYWCSSICICCCHWNMWHWLKPGFHYPSWRPELTGDRFPLPVNMGRVDGRAFPLAELTGRQHGHPSTRAVNSGSGNRAWFVQNIQSTNWQTLRFKPPPPGTDIGWRVEFRPTEVCIFIVIYCSLHKFVLILYVHSCVSLLVLIALFISIILRTLNHLFFCCNFVNGFWIWCMLSGTNLSLVEDYIAVLLSEIITY